MDDDALLELSVTLVRQASAAIMAVRAAGFAIDRKSDESPVTEADRVAEALIVEGLRRATTIPVIAEEEVAAGLDTAPAARFWLVDPLDGTREFAAGREEFTVNIGLIVDGRPWLGAVGIPATGEIFTGIMDRGAWKQTGDGPRHPIAARSAPPEGLTVMASRHYSDDPRLEPFLAGRKVAKVINAGSALKFCRLAEGVADLYPRFGPTMEWDTAAPQAVLEAAGGQVLRFDGTPLPYGQKGWTNTPFVATGIPSGKP